MCPGDQELYVINIWKIKRDRAITEREHEVTAYLAYHLSVVVGIALSPEIIEMAIGGPYRFDGIDDTTYY